jgi:hypothetical protein
MAGSESYEAPKSGISDMYKKIMNLIGDDNLSWKELEQADKGDVLRTLSRYISANSTSSKTELECLAKTLIQEKWERRH